LATDNYKLEHFGITAGALEETIAWYSSTFGFEVVKKFSKPSLQLTGALMKLQGSFLEVLSVGGAPIEGNGNERLIFELRRSGSYHVALSVDDIHACYQRLKAGGVELVTDILEDRFFFCKDRDGRLIEIKQGA
jgi:catechol 2,3-dioxygenase-like lactoylglutathione lyase family enzyme